MTREPFERKYTDQQREVIARARLDHTGKGKLYPTVNALREACRAGQLRDGDLTLEPFDPPSERYIKKLAVALGDRRRGVARSKLADVPHEDAVEQLRARLMTATEQYIEEVEAKLRREKDPATPKNAALLKENWRLLKEAAWRGGKPEARGPRPGRTGEGKARGEQEIRGTQLGNDLLEDWRQGEGAQSQPAAGQTENGTHPRETERGLPPTSEAATEQNGDGPARLRALDPQLPTVAGSEPVSAPS